MAKTTKNKKKSKNNASVEVDKVMTIIAYLFAIWIVILPLIVHFAEVDVPKQLHDLYMVEERIDLFNYWKSVWLYGGAVLFFGAAVILRLIYKISFKPTPLTYGLIAFSAIIVISYLLSDYKDFVWYGFVERYEGTFSWLCYCLAAYAVETFVVSKKQFSIVINGIIFSAAVVAIIGAFQYFKLDFFKTDLASRLMLGAKYQEYKDVLKFKTPPGMVYSTLYNPNYIGSFVTICLPLCAYAFNETKAIVLKAFYALVAIALLISLYGSESDGGMIAVVAMVFFFILFNILNFVPTLKNNILLKTGASALVMLVFALILINVPRVKAIFAESSNDHIGIVKAELKGNSIDIYTENDTSFSLISEGLELKVEYQGQNVEAVSDTNGQKNFIINNGSREYLIAVQNDEGLSYKQVDIMLNQADSVDKMEFWHYDGDFYIAKRKIQSQDLEVKSSNIFKNEQMLSNRGYIWNRAVPLVAEKPLFGYGADTFGVIFPQIDPVGRIGAYDSFPLMFVDKVHNLYLQLLINFGIIGLIAYLYLLSNTLKAKNIFFITAIFGFMVVGIVNDSVIAAMLINFIIITLSTLPLNREENKEQNI